MDGKGSLFGLEKIAGESCDGDSLSSQKHIITYMGTIEHNKTKKLKKKILSAKNDSQKIANDKKHI